MANGDVKTSNASLEFDTQSGFGNFSVKMDSNHFLNFGRDVDADARVQTFTVSTSTGAVTTANSSLEFDAAGTTSQKGGSANYIDATHCIAFYQTETDGRVITFAVNTTSWAVTTASDSLRFQVSGSNTKPSSQAIDANHFICFFQGTNDDGFAQAFTVSTSTWAVTTAALSLEFDTQNNRYNSCLFIDSTHFINFGAGGASYSGFSQVFAVNTTTGAISTSNSSLEFDTAETEYNCSYQIDSNHFINFGAGAGTRDGYAQVFTVSTSTGAVTKEGTALEFDTQNAYNNACYQVDSTHFINFGGGGASIYPQVQVFTVNTSTGAVTTSAGNLQFDTASGYDHYCIGIDSSHFINFGRGGDDDGFAQVFGVTLASSGPANLKTLNTNAFANIKSINTNLIANVKTYNTQT